MSYFTYPLGLLLLLGNSLYAQVELQEVKVEGQARSMQKAVHTNTNTTIVSKRELLKAACCNLAESFDTNPSVDANFPDPISGTRQIRMLGLTSPYMLISEENIPSIRGASQYYGLSLIPGTWIESLQLTKGMGSVINGYQSISGQLNVEFIKPFSDVPLFVNAYVGNDARTELNVQMSRNVGKNWASSLYVHGNARPLKFDMNNDGFMDNPTGQQLNLMHRWQYQNAQTGWESHWTLRALHDQRLAGQMSYNPVTDRGQGLVWGAETLTKRIEVANKTGHVFKDKPFQSFGVQTHVFSHQQQSYYGNTDYNIRQNSLMVNAMFQSILGSVMHKYTVGMQSGIDGYQENFNAADLGRTDSYAGLFAEYTYNDQDRWSLSLGGRLDYHNRMGVFVTPRVHVRYTPWKGGTWRASWGLGQRMAQVFAENQGYMASSRMWHLHASHTGAYGLPAEKAWNTGISFVQQWTLFGRKSEWSVDAYYTRFTQQVVVDVISDPSMVQLYALTGRSYAASWQTEWSVSPVKQLTFRLAYKQYQLSTSYLGADAAQPLQPLDRAFVNVEWYSSAQLPGRFWKADVTWNRTGRQRLPLTSSGEAPEMAAPFSLVNMQLTRLFSKAFELYAGIENAFNYRQPTALSGLDRPFGSGFDMSGVYAPLFGRMGYMGLRWKWM